MKANMPVARTTAPGTSCSLALRSRWRRPISITCSSLKEVTLLDYGAGNVRSVRNAIRKLGFTIREVESPKDIIQAKRLVFPGVGSFGQAMRILKERQYVDPLLEYVQAGRPFLGICLGLQLLFDGSDESGGCEGLGLVPGHVTQFDTTLGLPVPHIGWNSLDQTRPSALLDSVGDKRVYFVHSYRAVPSEANKEWVLSTSEYGGPFVSTVGRGDVHATQFHPEKSGASGLAILHAFLDPAAAAKDASDQRQRSGAAASSSSPSPFLNGSSSSASSAFSNSGGGGGATRSGLAKRVIACLDVRSNDQGDLVVTKGDQYDVREKSDGGDVRNLGKPVELAARYFDEGADEVAFLNITGFRDSVMADMPMLQVLQAASERVFVPLTVGGGIRGFTEPSGRTYSALEVAAEYFRSGADKVSIGSDAVYSAEEYYSNGCQPTGNSSIEAISAVYGKQAVVVSIDPRRVYVSDPASVPHATVRTARPGPNGEQYCWWQCTVRGGREGRPLGAVELAKAVQALGAGEILLNCIDNDGAGKGFDLELVEAVASAVTLPVIASSGAGQPSHFTDVFEQTHASAALAAGIFHRGEVSIAQVKDHMNQKDIPVRA